LIILTEVQEKELQAVLPDFDELLTKDSKRDLLFELDCAIVGMLDENYNSTEESRKYQRIYDDILYNTPDDDEA
jgi:predicted 2-oxoglutarate/Fe(II)-dependent dioxygenase YbiX